MKKYFVGLFIMAAAVCFTSCKNEAKNAPAKDGEKTEVKAEEQAAPAAEEKVELGDVIAKAKAEGANWSEDQWKAAIKDATKAMKPMLLEAQELQKKTEAAKTDEEKAALISEAAKMMEKYKDLEAQMTEFGKLIEGNPIAKKLNDDKAFEEEVKKELGLEDIDF